jgi:hypothetical protein
MPALWLEKKFPMEKQRGIIISALHANSIGIFAP